MDRRRVAKWAAALAFGGAFGSNAQAGAVTLTGNVGTDFPDGHPGIGVGVVAGQQPYQVAQAPWITQSGWVNGWVIKDVQLNYNKATDTMQVGVAFYSIAGDPSGNPTGSDPRVAAAGGSAPANLGGRDSITVEFAAPSTTNGNAPGAPVIVAGVPENKSSSSHGDRRLHRRHRGRQQLAPGQLRHADQLGDGQPRLQPLARPPRTSSSRSRTGASSRP